MTQYYIDGYTKAISFDDIPKILHSLINYPKNITHNNDTFSFDKFIYDNYHNFSKLHKAHMLIYACKYNQINLLKLIDNGEYLINTDFHYGNNNRLSIVHNNDKVYFISSPICYACYYGHNDIIKYLCEDIGLILDDFSESSYYPLQLAILNNKINVIEYIHNKFKLTNDQLLMIYADIYPVHSYD